jgi:hypothetical protein
MEMEVSDMLDVIHYFFEEDLRFSSSEQAEAQSKMRTEMYRTMYDVEYKYPIVTSSAQQGSRGGMTANLDLDLEHEDEESVTAREIKPFDPLKPPTKVYVPATSFDADSPTPFGKTLDAPLG